MFDCARLSLMSCTFHWGRTSGDVLDQHQCCEKEFTPFPDFLFFAYLSQILILDKETQRRCKIQFLNDEILFITRGKNYPNLLGPMWKSNWTLNRVSQWSQSISNWFQFRLSLDHTKTRIIFLLYNPRVLELPAMN